jgi:hypothetical protein
MTQPSDKLTTTSRRKSGPRRRQVPGSDASVLGRNVGSEAGWSNLAVRNMK